MVGRIWTCLDGGGEKVFLGERTDWAKAQRHENLGLSIVNRLWFNSVQVEHTEVGAVGRVDGDLPVLGRLSMALFWRVRGGRCVRVMWWELSLGILLCLEWIGEEQRSSWPAVKIHLHLNGPANSLWGADCGWGKGTREERRDVWKFSTNFLWELERRTYMALRFHALVLCWVAMTWIGIGVLRLVQSEILSSLRHQPGCSVKANPGEHLEVGLDEETGPRDRYWRDLEPTGKDGMLMGRTWGEFLLIQVYSDCFWGWEERSRKWFDK